MIDWIELHAASAFSFLEGASLPEELAARAGELGLSAVALCDRDGVYGAPRFYKAAKEAGVKPLVGAELTMPTGRLTVLVRDRTGYRNLCRLLTKSALGKPKGSVSTNWEDLASHAAGLHALTRKPDPRLSDIFPGRFHIELQRHLLKEEEAENRRLLRLGLPVLATNGVRYARRADKGVMDALWCLRMKCTLDAAGRRLDANAERHLKGAAEMEALFRDLPEALNESRRLFEVLEFTLADLGYRLPDFPLPEGETPDGFLRGLVRERAPSRFLPVTEKVRAQLEHELEVIRKLGFAGYFLILWDVVEYCRKERILVQGRGSAANSAVCFALGITAVDPVKMDLLFERFLSEERGEWPDVDLDLPSGEQREKVIQYLYRKYGAAGAAMTANVITYRPRLALREAAKVMGFSSEQVERLCARLGGLESAEVAQGPAALSPLLAAAGFDPGEPRLRKTMALWARLLDLPRHLGQHSGGMVLAAGRLDEIVPLEPAAMPGRVVLQWDKEDCADLGLVKIDLLGLGMLAALERALPLIERHQGVALDLAHLPPDDPETYAMIRRADTVGVFQLESRAQMASLVRHLPERFYDLVVQVAIIRPGPIVGGMVHPFFERRRGRAPVTYPHPCLEPILKRTFGVPLFQEQVLRIAMAAAGFSGGEAEEVRRAMGFKRSVRRMEAVETRLRAGMEARGIRGVQQDEIARLVVSFALYGFPESHAASFALLAYASSYLKAHHPAAFCAALLDCWPMGFYHPATLVKDAQRHGVEVLPIDVLRSGLDCSLEGTPPALRLGLRFVKGLRRTTGEAVAARRPYLGPADLAEKCGLEPGELDALAWAGALSCFGLTRRQALWQAARAGRPEGPLFAGVEPSGASPLPELGASGETAADLDAAGLSARPHPMAFRREELRARGVLSAEELRGGADGRSVKVAGSVIIRQRPPTAKGFLFLTLEDETGLVQAIVAPALYLEVRDVLRSPLLIVEGALQKEESQVSVRATGVSVI